MARTIRIVVLALTFVTVGLLIAGESAVAGQSGPGVTPVATGSAG